MRAAVWSGALEMAWSVKWSPDGERVLFSVGPDVYAVGVDGIGLRKVGDASVGGRSGPKTSLDVSPDGKRMVYSACYGRTGANWDSDEYELAIVNLKSGETRRLTRNESFDNYPAWSPDGERIAFLGNAVSGDDLADHLNVYTMGGDGTGLRLEAEGAAHHPPQWSPDGQRIAFVKFDGEYNTDPAIYVVTSRSGEVTRLTDAVSGLTWSPDGEQIAFAKVFGDEVALYKIGADGTGVRLLAAIEGWESQFGYGREPDPAKAWIRKVAWSPDGSKILVLANEHSDGAQIAAVDGSGSAWVTVRQPVVRSIEHAAWSPDGERIAMVGEFATSQRDVDDPTAQIALVTTGMDGSAPRVLVGKQEDGRLAGLGVARGDISAEVAACGEGVAVPDPEANLGLVDDCEVLLEVQNAIAGPGGLNWLVDRDIREWEGVVVDGSPLRVREIVIKSRGLVGEIPTELTRLTELRVLDMSRNALMGEILPELGELKDLEWLILSRNYLSGEIPPELGGLSKLMHLALTTNNLHGEIPPELGGLSKLTRLALTANDLDGEIPAELAQLTNLTGLVLDSNRLRGEIPAELGQLTDLGYLNLSDNELTGEIPAELGRLSELTNLNLAHNELTGKIPAELGRLNELTNLNLAHNHLAGEIPAELGGLGSLARLYLAYNRLTGEIPVELGELTNLTWLELFGNRFTGCLPENLRELFRKTHLDELELSICE